VVPRIPGKPRVMQRVWWLAFGGSVLLAALLVALAAYAGR
jgi:hypothetical protein